MTRDPRLNLDVAIHDERENAGEERTLMESLDDTGWSVILDPLIAAILKFARNEGVGILSFPESGDRRFQASFDRVLSRMTGGAADYDIGLADTAFEKKLVQCIATRLPEDVSAWLKIAGLFRNALNWASFLEHVPLADIQRELAGLLHVSLTAENCFEAADLPRRSRDQWIRMLDERLANEMNEWSRAMLLRREAGQCILNESLSVRSKLISRSGAGDWLAWACGLPHPVLTAMAVERIDDLNFIEALVRECVANESIESRTLLLLLTVKQATELWRSITENFRNAAMRYHHASSGDLQIMNRMKNEWDAELPGRVRNVVGQLCVSDSAIPVARLFLKYQGAYNERWTTSFGIRPDVCFRDQLINELVRCNVDFESFQWDVDPTTTSLLAGALLAIRLSTENDFDLLFLAYEGWLQAGRHIWHERLSEEEDALVRELAVILPQVPNSVQRACGMISTLKLPSQGWKFDYGRWLGSLPALTHGIIVTALAAQCAFAAEGCTSKSDGLMNLAWAGLDSVLRTSPYSIRASQVASPVAYVWGSAAHVFARFPDLIERALRRMDDVELLIHGASNFQSNRGVLSTEAKRIIREKFESQRAVLSLSRHCGAQKLSQLSDAMERLFADSEEVPQGNGI